tara:strand:- start:248 stop:673 length:426 start_codon:yes stop_codon:yes gene_type:complete
MTSEMKNLVKKTGKGLAKALMYRALIFAPLTIGGGGCGDSSQDYFCKTGEYNGWDVFVKKNDERKSIRIISRYSDIQSLNEQIYSFEDSENKGFEKIEEGLVSLDESPLKNYANPDSINKIYAEIREKGVDCEIIPLNQYY